MKIQKYKTINNKYVSKDVPITKIDIKVAPKKEDDNGFDIFESKEYIYNKSKKENINSILESINSKQKLLEIKNNSEKNTNYTDLEYNDILINKKNIDISKEIDEDIYSDFKENIEKSVYDEKILDNPYKSAIILSQEETKNRIKNNNSFDFSKKDDLDSKKEENSTNSYKKSIYKKIILSIVFILISTLLITNLIK